MAEALNTAVASVAIGIQTAEGVYREDADRTLLILGTNAIAPTRTTQNVPYLDGNIFGRGLTYLQQVEVGGTIQVACTPEDASYLYSACLDNDSVNGAAPTTHLTHSNSNSRVAVSLWQSLGYGAVQDNTFFGDCFIKSIELDASQSGTDGVTLNVEIVGQAMAHYETAPTVADFTRSPQFHWTQLDGNLKLDSVALNGGDSVTLKIDKGTQLLWGTSVDPYAASEAKGSIEVNGSVILDAVGLARYYTEVYGVATPADGAELSKEIIERPFEVTFSNGKTGADLRSLTLTYPAVTITSFDSPQPDVGGTKSLAFTGQAYQAADGTAAVTVTAVTADTAAYVSSDTVS